MKDRSQEKIGVVRIPMVVSWVLFAATLGLGLHLRSTAAREPSDPTGSPAVATAAKGPVSMTARVDRRAVLAGTDGRLFLELVLKAEDAPPAGAAVPTDFLVVLDRSGSMAGEKMEQGRAAIHELLQRLRPRDRLGLVTYSDEAEVVFPLGPASAEAKTAWAREVRGIEPVGSTNLSAGIDLAYESLRGSTREPRAVRVLLISDGLANRGDVTPEGLLSRAARFSSREQVLSTIGVGLDFNEVLMSSLADAGTGNYYYLQRSTELAEVFTRELATGRETVASGLSVLLEPEAGVEVLEAAGFPLSRDGRGVRFRPGTLFSGQERKIFIAYRVPSDSVASYGLGSVRLDYRTGGADHTLELPRVATIACVEEQDRFFASIDEDAWQASVLGESYGQLKDGVARAVREGDLAAAKTLIGAYRAEKEWMNGTLRAPAVSENLEELASLEAKVEDAFRGRDQALKQNALGKATQAEAGEARRAGSKK